MRKIGGAVVVAIALYTLILLGMVVGIRWAIAFLTSGV